METKLSIRKIQRLNYDSNFGFTLKYCDLDNYELAISRKTMQQLKYLLRNGYIDDYYMLLSQFGYVNKFDMCIFICYGQGNYLNHFYIKQSTKIDTDRTVDDVYNEEEKDEDKTDNSENIITYDVLTAKFNKKLG